MLDLLLAVLALVLRAFSPNNPVLRPSQKPKLLTSNQITNDSQLTAVIKECPIDSLIIASNKAPR